MSPLLRLALVTALVVSPSPRAQDAARIAPASSSASWVPRGIETLPPEFIEMLRANPYAFFRLVNRAWATRVCSAFGDEAQSFVRVRLHGDAHVEQYAVTASAFGLDDFDDTAEGPAVIDLVRFIGSILLAVRERGWTSDTDAVIDAFLRGYRQGLNDPATLPSPPQFVRRVRERPVRSQAEFLAWAEGLMTPVPALVEQETRRGLAVLAERTASGQSRMPRGYFTIKRIGGLQLGVGSRRLPKLLVRIEGRSSAANDDLILEAKEPAANLAGLGCLALPDQSPAARVVTGARQVGRLEHEVLTIVPRPIAGPVELRHWWIHDWAPSYIEIDIHMLDSAAELADLARDAGVQLGSAGLPSTGAESFEKRRQASNTIDRLDSRIREVAHQITDDMLSAWTEFGRGIH